LINSRDRLQKSDINLEQSSHVETVCQLVKQSADDGGRENCVEKEGLENVKAKNGVRRDINYREEEIVDCGCIYG